MENSQQQYPPLRRATRLPFFLLIGAAGALALGAAVMLLWNAVVPEVTGARRISYWQAVGLLVLCRLLVGGLGRGGRPGYGSGPRFGQRGAALREKWMQMTPEERSNFRTQWRERCGMRKKNGG